MKITIEINEKQIEALKGTNRIFKATMHDFEDYLKLTEEDYLEMTPEDVRWAKKAKEHFLVMEETFKIHKEIIKLATD